LKERGFDRTMSGKSPWALKDVVMTFSEFINRMRKNTLFTGCSKRSRYKAPEILRNEAYIEIRRIACPAEKRGGIRAIPPLAG
jgi:hypothetical protein